MNWLSRLISRLLRRSVCEIVPLLLTIRAWFTPAVIDILKVGPKHRAYEEFPMGIQLVAIDAAKTRWTIVEGIRRARCNRVGCFVVEGKGLNETFVFSLKEARAMVAQLLSDERVALVSEQVRLLDIAFRVVDE